jgi:hypothetical protein
MNLVLKKLNVIIKIGGELVISIIDDLLHHVSSLQVIDLWHESLFQVL